jgi:hypothetical protein
MRAFRSIGSLTNGADCTSSSMAFTERPRESVKNTVRIAEAVDARLVVILDMLLREGGWRERVGVSSWSHVTKDRCN